MLYLQLKKIDDYSKLCFYLQVLRALKFYITTFIVSLFILFPFFSFETVCFSAHPVENIRVAIAKNESSVKIEGEGIIATTEELKPLVLEKSTIFTPVKNLVASASSSCKILTIAAPTPIKVNGKYYRGKIELRNYEKGILIINEIPLEDYLVGLINAEISSAWPIEAVKAQAVIARTYALNRREARKDALYHLESSVLDQVYSGSDAEDSRALRAVKETASEVLTYNNEIIQAFYHSQCGGKTESAENVWGAKLPYVKGVDCKYCNESRPSLWENRLKLDDISEKFRKSGYKVGSISDIRTGARNNRGRIANITVESNRGSVTVTGDQFRKIIGYSVIKSTNFMVRVSADYAFFSGYGNGHGVGMCQWGAKQRALDRFSYSEILSYYYPGTELKKLGEF